MRSTTRHRTRWASLALGAALVAPASLAPGTALAHSWYDADCCGDQDCEPIPEASITFRGPGQMMMRDSKGIDWHIRLGELRRTEPFPPLGPSPDAEMLSEAWRRYIDGLSDDPRPMRRTSQDGHHHLCIRANRVHCVYFPAGG